MAENTQTHAVATYMEAPGGHQAEGHAVAGQDVAGSHGGSSAVDAAMFFWFLLIFGIAAYILKKFAFSPILENLDHREAEIEQSLENADTLRREMSQLDEKVKGMVEEADKQTREMIDHARDAAKEAARGIEEKAREEAAIIKENADRDIKTARGKAEASLRASSADVAVELTMKLLNQTLDAKGRKALTDQLIAEM